MREIPIRARLKAGQAATVVSGHHNADMIDFLGQFGFDGVWIECEHGPVSWEQIGDYSRACDLWGMASIVRVSVGEPWMITRTLDRGASGIVVPHVSSRALAEQVGEAARFGALGRRGIYGSRRSYGVADGYNRANEEILVCILIEEREAIENLGEILKAELVDVFFVAPGDLAQTMGFTGRPDHPDVQRTVDDAIKRIVDAGRIAGTVVAESTIDHYHSLGARFYFTSWTKWVAAGARGFNAQRDRLNGTAASR